VYRKPILTEQQEDLDGDSSGISEAADYIEELEDQPQVELALPWPLCGSEGPQVQQGLPEGVSSHFAQNLVLAWYKVAQNRVDESKQAEQWKRHLVPSNECKSCGVRGDDGSTFSAGSLWGSSGPCLRVVETKNIYDLLEDYEGDDAEEWRSTLEEECWSTLCWRCANLQGFRPAPLTETAAQQEDISSSDVSSDGEAQRFVDWTEVHVSEVSREMLLTWARCARMRLHQQGRSS
jgi:hypothetical protein